jgi:sarcosine oxidase
VGGGQGFPIYDRPGFKFGVDSDREAVVDPDEMAREPTAEDEADARAFAETFFPEGAGPTLAIETCIVTYSRDDHFVLGRVPDYDSVTVGAGFSGHGFKFTSVIGEVLADLVTEGTTDHDIDVHAIERP